MDYEGKDGIQQKSLLSLTDSLMAEKARQEQLSIVNKYAKGPGHEDESDDETIFSVTDQYGFLHKTEPAEVPKQEEDRRKLIEVKRRTKWLKMVRNWDKYVGSERLTKRVYKGIPHGMKDDVWRMLLGVNQYMENMPEVYTEMKTRAHSHSPDIRQIDMDVNRTYRDHVMFKTRYSIKQQQLFHVLAAYSMYNTEVGYCQGMSQIAALLLMYMSEEEAFWALHSLLYGDKHRMHGFFIPGFPKLLRFQNHHDRLLKKMMPKLKKHLDENEVFASLYTMKWFFQCFLDRTPFSLTLRLWDIYILEGEKLLTAMSYATLKMHKAHLKSQEMDGIVAFLQEQLVKDFGFPDDAVIEYLKACMVELKRAGLDRPPPPTDVEKPKLPFGSFVPNFDKVAVARNVPQFAKHSVDIETLVPEMKRKGSKKKREKVKRGKSNSAKHATANGLEVPEVQMNTKGSKSFKDTPPGGRSPILRSMRKDAKTEKRKEAVHEDERKTKVKSKEKQKPDKGTGAVRKSTPDAKVVEDERVSPVLASSKEEKQDDKDSNGKTVPFHGNGKQESAEKHEQHTNNHKHEIPLSTFETDKNHSPNKVISHNNSNNLPNDATEHRQMQSHVHAAQAGGPINGHPKSFIPPILANNHRISTGSHEPPSISVEDNVFSPKTEHTSPPAKFKPMWRTPHHGEPSTSQSNVAVSSYRQGDAHVFNSKENDTESRSTMHGVKLRTSYLRSQSSDILNYQPSEDTLKKKTPSFSQLSATIDSLENLNRSTTSVHAISPTWSSATTSPVHLPAQNRPQSIYDNVTYPYHPSTSHHMESVPAIPESPGDVNSLSSFEQGLEVGGFRRKGHRRKSMEHTVDADDEMSAPYADEHQTFHHQSGSKSMDNLREWTARNKRGKRKGGLSSRYTHNSITNQNTNSDRQENGLLNAPAGGLLRSPVRNMGHHVTDNATAEKIIRSRKMNREEMLSATMLSQMRHDGLHKAKLRSPKRANRVSKNSLDGWEAEGGALLSSPALGQRGKERHVEPPTPRPRLLLQNDRITPSSKRPNPGDQLSFSESDGWSCVEIDGVGKDLPPKPSLTGGNLQNSTSHSDNVVKLNTSPSKSSLYGGAVVNGTPTKGIAYYSRHDLSHDDGNRFLNSNVTDSASSGIDVTRYEDNIPSPTSPHHWIDITKYSPNHSPTPVRANIPPRVLSQSLSNTTKAEINELLAVGINANPNVLARYRNASAISPQDLNSEYVEGRHTRSGDRTLFYRVPENPDVRNGRRQSVNMAVQTEERGVI